MARTIYIIRHAERMDNVDNNWRKKVGNEYKSDNSPLSAQGHKQCVELAEWFKDIEVDHIFASPFDRTLDTATRMIGDRGIPIKPEAGFLEALYLCCKPPGVRPWNILKETYPLIDETYDPVVNPWKEGFKDEGPGDDACTDRIKDAIEKILNKYEGDIIIVSHGSPIAVLLEILTGKWSYVGQATVSKLVEKKNGKYEALSIAGHAHLSDKRNLRAWVKNVYQNQSGHRPLNESYPPIPLRLIQPHGQIYGPYPLNAFLPPPDPFRQRIIGGYYAQVPKSSNTNIQQYYIPTAQTFNFPSVHPHRPEAPFIPPRQYRHHLGQNSLSPSTIVATTVENAISKEEGEIDNDVEIISDQSCSVAPVNSIGLNQGIIGEPTFNDIYGAYNVFSIKDLRELLCRGNPFYNKSFDVVTNNFRKTLVAYPPNNDIVRLLHYAMKSESLLKEINSDAREDCELCGEKLTLEHLLSAKHVKKYKAVYHNEPPEILTLLEPKNYALYIHPGTLNNLKIDAIKEMEKSPQFSTMKCLQNFKQVFTLKYKLIHRILESNFEISHKKTFSIDKIFFLRERTNNPALREIFAKLYTPYDCEGCKYTLPKKNERENFLLFFDMF